MAINAYEVNFDGLIGPSHHFAGLSFGNIASMTNEGRVSNPRQAALQGLSKMKLLHDLGIKQAILPPVKRPDARVLANLGFGSGKNAIEKLKNSDSPDLTRALFSASSMWTANAATISPGADTFDGKVHITPANLIAKLHRAMEASQTTHTLRQIFSASEHFTVHDPLFAHPSFGDEGAANHTRLCERYHRPGLELFVYGRSGFGSGTKSTSRFPARQTIEASQAVARQHGLDPRRTVFAKQHPRAIDAGAFHNDVVSVGNASLFFYHENAFLHETEVLAEITQKMISVSDKQPAFIRVRNSDVSLEDSVQSYLFNSQLVSTFDHLSGRSKTLMIAPIECQETTTVRHYLDSVVPGPEIDAIHFVDLRESMQNGGGPACLRLRVVLNSAELSALHQKVLFTDELYNELEAWIKKHYRDKLSVGDLYDAAFIDEIDHAFESLGQLLHLKLMTD
jgi:succinylarginine dihydrolase